MIKRIYWISFILKTLIWISVSLYFVEISMGSDNSLDENMQIFLWIERTIACVFMTEYFFRAINFQHNNSNNSRNESKVTNYLLSTMGIIDLLAWAPFFIGFFVPISWLGWIRTLRILRLLKFFRYSRSLQLVALGFYKSMTIMKPLIFSMMIVCLFSSAIIYECEHVVQPETYNNVINCIWFSVVSATTVGYGDMSPQTTIGKIMSIFLLFIPAIFIFSAIVGTISNSYNYIIDMEKDPNIDPIEEFKKLHYTKRNKL